MPSRNRGPRSRVPSDAEYAELVTCEEQNYDAQLAEKVSKAQSYIGRAMGASEEEGLPEPVIFGSPKKFFRQRVNFRVVVEDDQVHYVMHSKHSSDSSDPLQVTTFPRGDERINKLMPIVKRECDRVVVLRRKIVEIRFHSTLRGGVMVLLCYSGPIGANWVAAAEEFVKILRTETNDPTVLVVGRSKKVQLMAPAEDDGVAQVTETLRIPVEGDDFLERTYRQLEGEFTQPNALVCEQMLGWAHAATSNCCSEEEDLLELYCGNGNFGIALAGNFRKVLATEMSKPNTALARANVAENLLTNVKIARLNAAEVAEALAPGARQFNRLNDQEIKLNDYHLTTVLVDPPRAGLDDAALKLVLTFPTILYISCNPESLARDLLKLRTTHSISRFAVFDQFPYSDHVELGLLLVKRDVPKTDFPPSSVDAAPESSVTKSKQKKDKKKDFINKKKQNSKGKKRKFDDDPVVAYDARRGRGRDAPKRRRLFSGCTIS